MTLALALVAGVLLGTSWLTPAAASDRIAASPRIPAPSGLTSTDVSFQGFGGLTLHGTVLSPARSRGRVPGVVLVTGSGAGVPREHLLTEATQFARRGLAVLIYDKRSEGYTDLRRSFSELADDALGAVGALRARPGVDPAKVGLWGLSEGGWVAPLAASRSADVAFVIVVGGNAMSPIRQQVWNETSGLRRAGVSGSLLDHAKRNFARLGADAGLFAEAFFDAEGVLERVRQPLLGIWGEHDLQTPPADNPPRFARALRRGGNTHYTFRFFPNADHGAHVTPDGGLTRGEALAPGYADLVGSWVRDVTSGRLPDADAAAPPAQDHRSTEISPSPWWASGWSQLAAFALFVVAFTAYPLTALVRRVRGRTVRPVTRWARLLAGAGLMAVLGGFVYIFYLMAAGRWPDPGPVLAGRPLPWLVVQGLAVAAVAATVATVAAWWRTRRGTGEAVPAGERVRTGLLLTGGVVFVPWAVYWGLLVP
ncbi:alpha/beta hydrolase [Actinomadura spongiicola]|uniref:Alpha/beta hydrolase n=2 Tax=Actinomadura spongiicola TaxID=2303421 RepID=A0A372GAH4_9ACTN|nr:alpha/beta hydrolase [Actinomadura spongiicola]